MTEIDSASRRQRRGRLMLLLLAGCFLLGIVIAVALFVSGWRPVHTGNYGELVEPPRPLKVAASFTILGGGTLEAQALRGKWTYVTFTAADCLRPCEENLYKMRQVVAAQGKDAPRVQRWLVVSDTRALDWLRYTLEDYPGMQVIIGPPAAVRAFAGQFALPAGTPDQDAGRIYLVDPLGNLMMSYPPGADPNGMRKDLARLLRVSRIG